MSKESYKVRASRKIYWPFYLMALVIALILIIFYIKGNEIHSVAFWLAIVFIILTIKYTELNRLNDFYEINPMSLIHCHGLINKKIKSIDYFAISDLDIDQSLTQRMMNIGSVNIRLFSEDSTTSVKNIPHPEKFAQELEKTIMKKRRRLQEKNGNL